jgi:hypothetical protein
MQAFYGLFSKAVSRERGAVPDRWVHPEGHTGTVTVTVVLLAPCERAKLSGAPSLWPQSDCCVAGWKNDCTIRTCELKLIIKTKTIQMGYGSVAWGGRRTTVRQMRPVTQARLRAANAAHAGMACSPFPTQSPG